MHAATIPAWRLGGREPPSQTARRASRRAAAFSRFSRRAAGDPPRRGRGEHRLRLPGGGLDHDSIRAASNATCWSAGDWRHAGHRLNKADLAGIRRCRWRGAGAGTGRRGLRGDDERPESLGRARASDPRRTGSLLGSSGSASRPSSTAWSAPLLRVNDVRESDSRGRHTSTNRICAPAGRRAVDRHTGMRELQLWTVAAWRDVHGCRGSSAHCRFRNAGIATSRLRVIRAVAAGDVRSRLKASASWTRNRNASSGSRTAGNPRAQRQGRIGAKALRKRVREGEVIAPATALPAAGRPPFAGTLLRRAARAVKIAVRLWRRPRTPDRQPPMTSSPSSDAGSATAPPGAERRLLRIAQGGAARTAGTERCRKTTLIRAVAVRSARWGDIRVSISRRHRTHRAGSGSCRRNWRSIR